MLPMHAAIPAVIKPDLPQEVVQKELGTIYTVFLSDTKRSQPFERYNFCNSLDNIF